MNIIYLAAGAQVQIYVSVWRWATQKKWGHDHVIIMDRHKQFVR